MKHLFFTLLLLLSFVENIAAVHNNKVLVISSYASDYQWSNSIIDAIQLELKRDYPEIELHVEYLSSEHFMESEIWVKKINFLFSNYQKELPRAIVLISDEAWMAFRTANNSAFKDIPVVLCAVKPHTIELQKYHEHYGELQWSDFVPTRTIMKDYNATGVLRELNIGANIDLMYNILPQTDQFAFITDSRIYGQYSQLLFKEYVQKKYPSIPVRYIDATNITTDSLLRVLPQITSHTGLLMTSWLTGDDGFAYSKDFLYRRMASALNTPIFITNDIGLNTNNFIGGYFYDSEYWGGIAGRMLAKILSGILPKDILVETHKSDICNINWPVFKKYNLSMSKLPPKVKFTNRPPSFIESYGNEFALFVAIILLFIVSFVYIFRQNIKLRLAQKNTEIAVQNAHSSNRYLDQAKKDLEVALAKAEEADRLKSAFIANMDSEIRTPLNAIIGFAELIGSLDTQEDRDEAAMHIKQNSEELLNLIMRILDLSRLESGEVDLKFETASAEAMCRDLISSYQYKCPTDVNIYFVPPISDIILYTDMVKVSRVLNNFIGNAVKFTNKGTIEVGCFPCAENHVEFYVKDTGIGIATKEIDQIFERFVKLGSYVGGAGLGLPIARKIVQLLGGEIGVTSTLGEGSRFWFRIKKEM